MRPGAWIIPVLLIVSPAVSGAPIRSMRDAPTRTSIEQLCEKAGNITAAAWQGRQAGITEEEILRWYVDARKRGKMTEEYAIRGAFFATMAYRQSFADEAAARRAAYQVCVQQPTP